MRVLVLVISDDSLPVYAQNREAMRECVFNTHPDFDCYFIENNPNVEASGITGARADTFVSKSYGGFGFPIIQKTAEAIAFFTEKTEYDFVLRTNLSSFWVFSLLARVVKTLPTKGCLYGIIGDHHNKPFVSGAGMLMSIDVARYISRSWRQVDCPDDDVGMSQLAAYGGAIFILGRRLDLPYGLNSLQSTDFLEDKHYHYRLKALDPSKRHEEAEMMRTLRIRTREHDGRISLSLDRGRFVL